jgi:hypothetical protein
MANMTESLSLSGFRDIPARPIRWDETDVENTALRYVLFVMLPLWIVPGVLDWYWHKSTDIEHTAGIEESIIHSLMMTQVGVPIFAGLLFEVNPLLLTTMFGALVVHSATAIWDVAYAVNHREVKTREQHTHSFLEILPLMAVSFMVCLHGPATHRLLTGQTRADDWKLRWKRPRLPFGYLAAMAGVIAVGIALPYGNELWRCWRARRQPKYNSGFYREDADSPDARNC